jgi:hypothetical protein
MAAGEFSPPEAQGKDSASYPCRSGWYARGWNHENTEFFLFLDQLPNRFAICFLA